MGRRSNFQRIDKDAYDTPPEAVLPLLPYLNPERGSSSRAVAKERLRRLWRLTGTIASIPVT